MSFVQRHKFITSYALKAFRETLAWRLTSLPDSTFCPLALSLHCLPAAACDPFGPPVLLIRLSSLIQNEDLRPSLVQNMECLRLHLERMNKDNETTRPVLQYVALLDVEGLSFRAVVCYVFLAITACLDVSA